MLIRYPGSKAKLIDEIAKHFPFELCGPLFSDGIQYVEPFFGAGAVGFEVMRRLSGKSTIWINDIDFGMFSLWTTVRDNPKGLMDRVMLYEPSVEDFHRFKADDGNREVGTMEAAFRKLALHQMSFSGLGAMAGGPLGGSEQAGTYSVDCRWNPETLQGHIREANSLMRRFKNFRITNIDFQAVVEEASTRRSFIYLDPPYFEKGPVLYRHSMSSADHWRLANALRQCRQKWVLSYDDHPNIRELYEWADVRQVELTYTGAVAKGGERPKNREIVLFPREVA